MSNDGPDPAANAISRNPATGVLIEIHPFQTAEQIEALPGTNQVALKQWRDLPIGERASRHHALAATPRASVRGTRRWRSAPPPSPA